MVGKKVFIYGLVCPVENRVMYVGGSENIDHRFITHTKGRSSKAVNKWVADLKKNGLAPKLSILEECDESCWEEKEVKWIAEFGLGTLLNTHKGGRLTKKKAAPRKKRVKKAPTLINVTKDNVPEAFRNLRSACKQHGWKYWTIARKKLPVVVDGYRVSRDKLK